MINKATLQVTGAPRLGSVLETYTAATEEEEEEKRDLTKCIYVNHVGFAC